MKDDTLKKMTFAELQELAYRTNKANSHDAIQINPLTPDQVRENSKKLSAINKEIRHRRDSRAQKLRQEFQK